MRKLNISSLGVDMKYQDKICKQIIYFVYACNKIVSYKFQNTTSNVM